MRTRAPVSVGARLLQVLLWLALGTGAWLVFVDRSRHESWLLYPVALAGTALALFLLAWLRRAGLACRIDEFTLTGPKDLPAPGKPVPFTLRVTARRPVPVRLIVATLSVVDDARDEAGRQAGLPTVLGREEAVLAERTRLEPGRTLELAGTLATPQDDPSMRLQLDAVLFIGSRPARRTTLLLRKSRPGKTA